MQLRDSSLPSQDETDDHPGKSPAHDDKPADVLQSQIITAFEAAIDRGMRPMDALAVILAWISSEITRIQAEQAKRSYW